MKKAILELHVTLQNGHEVECAKHLAANVGPDCWPVLVALAAEILTEDERRRQGSVVVLVTGEAAAERVLRDLKLVK